MQLRLTWDHPLGLFPKSWGPIGTGPMSHRKAFEAVDRLLRDITKTDDIMGGKLVRQFINEKG